MIDACPGCGYLLIGLSNECTCPECGLRCEREGVVVEQVSSVWATIALLSSVAIVVVTTGWEYGRRRSLLLILLPYAVLLTTQALWRLRRPRRSFTVSKRALRILGDGRLDAEYPLTGIRFAECRRLTGDVLVTAHDGSLLLRIPHHALCSYTRAKRLAAAINEYASRAAGGDKPQDGHPGQA